MLSKSREEKGGENMKKLLRGNDWEKFNSESIKVVEFYERELEREKKSPTTIANYSSSIKTILEYIKEEHDNISILQVTRENFMDFEKVQRQTGKSIASVNVIISCCRQMLEKAQYYFEEYDKNVLANLKQLKAEAVQEINFISNDEIAQLRQKLLEREMYQECLLLDILYDSGARISEVLQVEGVTTNYTNCVIGKGSKHINLRCNTRALESIELHRLTTNIKGRLWRDKRNSSKEITTAATLRNWVKSMGEVLTDITGIQINLRPHDIRHSTIRNYYLGNHYACSEIGYSDGVPLQVLSAIVHHNSLNLTQKYANLSDIEIQERRIIHYRQYKKC